MLLLSISAVVEATQGTLIRLKRWSEYWFLLLNPKKCEAFFFSMDPHQANLQPHLLLFNAPIHFNSTPTFLGVTFDRTLSFSKRVFLPKAKSFSPLKALRCTSASSCDPSKESLSLLNFSLNSSQRFTLYLCFLMWALKSPSLLYLMLF